MRESSAASRVRLLLMTSLVPLLLSLAWMPLTASAADVCAVPFKTLTLNCNGQCAANASCLVYSSSETTPCDYSDVSSSSSCVRPTTSTSCVYQCFAPVDSTSFNFFVAFNTTARVKKTSGSTAAATTAPPTNSSADGDVDAPYETNEFVRRVDVLNLPSSNTRLMISGGRNPDTGTRGQVVDVEFDPAAFSNLTEVTRFAVMNTNLGKNLPDIAAILPKQASVLDLTNSNLTQVPPSLATLTLMDAMSIEKNYLTEIPTTLRLPELRSLYLSVNSLTSFATNFSELQILDLSTNLLTSFPTIIFNLPKLNTLKLDKNPTMAPVKFTESQFARISRLEEFSIDASVLDTTSCSANQLKALPQMQTVSVCVVSDSSSGNNVTNVSNAPATTAPVITESGGMSTLTIVAIIVAVILALVVCAVSWYAYKNFRRNYDLSEGTRTVTDPSHDGGFTKMSEPSAPSAAGSVSNGSRPSKATGSGGGVGSVSSGSRPSKKSRHATLLSSGDSALNTGHSLWDDEEMISHQLDNEDIEDIRVIGSGGFALVWLVKYRPQNRLLASKRLIRDQVTRQKTLDFVLEIKLNMQLVHPSVVQFVGVAWTIETDLQALFEFMSNGDLRAYLEVTPVTPWSEQKLKMAIDIIEALVYVHSFSPPLVHRDLKSRNVLLNREMKAKLSDFGVSRFASDHGTMTAGVGTGKWLAPEVIAGSTTYDSSCDIYSFGVLLSEIDTHAIPYDDLRGAQDNKLPEVAVLQMVATGELKPTLRPTCPPALRKVAEQCLSFEPSERPTAMQAAFALRTAVYTLFASSEGTSDEEARYGTAARGGII